MTTLFPLRLNPNSDLKESLVEFASLNSLRASSVLTCVGSLKFINLRMPSMKSLERNGPFEILSLVGTLSKNGIHLHIAVSDEQGQTFGGHLLSGNLIHTTAEIVLIESLNHEFHREFDSQTGYKELSILNRK